MCNDGDDNEGDDALVGGILRGHILIGRFQLYLAGEVNGVGPCAHFATLVVLHAVQSRRQTSRLLQLPVIVIEGRRWGRYKGKGTREKGEYEGGNETSRHFQQPVSVIIVIVVGDRKE